MSGAREKPKRAGTIRWVIAGAVLAADLFVFIWLYPLLQSHVVMGVYSAQQMPGSVLAQCDVDIRIPRADGWYPRMLLFNADGFAAWSGMDADMAVLYSFGAFDVATRTSSLYDTGSDLYSAFYGAYAVTKESGIFGFYENGALNMADVTAAVEYDYTRLVMANFGCENPVFEVGDLVMQEDVVCAGIGGWTRIDARLRVNGAAHAYDGNKLAYLQYGKPLPMTGAGFAEIDMAGRVYAKYFPDYGCTVMLYCIAPNVRTVNECDEQALNKAVIQLRSGKGF